MAYIYDLTDTWSAGGTVFNAIKMNVTDSASAVASKLVSLQTNGTEHFSVTKAGAGYFSGNVGIGVASLANTRIYVRTAAITDTAYYADNGSNSGFKVKFASSLTSILNDFGADLVLGTNDTERMRITSTGDVGIGTTSPSQKLNVVGNTLIPITNSYFCYTNDYGIGTPDSLGLQVFASNGDVLRFGHRTGGTTFTEDMRIASNGNVGIGTAAPDTRMTVSSTSQYAINTLNPTAVAANKSGIAFYGLNSSTATQFYAGIAADFVATAGGSQTGALVFETINNNSVGERMRITGPGNVGIGTSSPGAKLDIVGAGNPTITLRGSDAAYSSILNLQAASGGTSIINATGGSNVLGLYTNTVERMRIDSSGNVLVGNTSQLLFTTKELNVNAASGSAGFALGTAGSARLYMTGTSTEGNVTTKGAIPLLFGTNETERMRITAAGGLAVGTTTDPGAGNIGLAAGKFLQFSSTAYMTPEDNVAGARIVTPGAFNVATGGTAVRMTLDALGQLGIGCSPGYRLDVAAGDTTAGIGYAMRLRSNATATAATIQFTDSTVSTQSGIITCTDAGIFTIQADRAGGTIRFLTVGNERARIDSSGNLLVGTTVATFGTSVGMRVFNSGSRMELGATDSTNDTVGYDMYSTGASAYRFFVGWGGTIYATSTSISAISDQRLKENVRDLDTGLDTILALKPRRFDWKEGKGKDVKDDMGFIAQEVETVLPELIGGWKAGEGEPDDLKSVKAGDLIPVLVKAIQELTARVAQLEGN